MYCPNPAAVAGAPLPFCPPGRPFFGGYHHHPYCLYPHNLDSCDYHDLGSSYCPYYHNPGFFYYPCHRNLDSFSSPYHHDLDFFCYLCCQSLGSSAGPCSQTRGSYVGRDSRYRDYDGCPCLRNPASFPWMTVCYHKAPACRWLTRYCLSSGGVTRDPHRHALSLRVPRPGRTVPLGRASHPAHLVRPSRTHPGSPDSHLCSHCRLHPHAPWRDAAAVSLNAEADSADPCSGRQQRATDHQQGADHPQILLWFRLKKSRFLLGGLFTNKWYLTLV